MLVLPGLPARETRMNPRGTAMRRGVRRAPAAAALGGRRPGAFVVVGLLTLSAVAVAVAPLALPAGYVWCRHSVSEAAAQATSGAWVARLGLLAFGGGVLALAGTAKSVWPKAATWSLSTFGVALLATAAFSHLPWLPDLPYDPVEDALHSFAATAMGFAFVVGVMARAWSRGGAWGGRGGDLLALLAAIVAPLVMVVAPEVGGLAQRTMFAVAYLWFGREVLGVARGSRAGGASPTLGASGPA
jgi:hypothetical protein